MTVMRDSLFAGLGQRGIATMDTIELAALEEFLARGFDETTADHIASRAGVSIRTLFRYFPRGKDDIIVLQFRRLIDTLVTAYQARPPQESAWRALRAAVTDSLSAGAGLSLQSVQLHRTLAASSPGLHDATATSQFRLAEPLVQMASLRMSVDPAVDLRPRLMVHAFLAASLVSWLAWLGNPDSDGVTDFERALDVLEVGMAQALQ
jgi:AcrR family transcriptional regulator